MASLAKGHRGPINVTQESRRRVFVGLGWDPKASSGLLENAAALVTGKALHHDLDLSCYIYDPNGALIDIIGVETQHASDIADSIYHSGDNVEGIGDGDDEQISVELKNINPDIAHIVFVATIKSGHSFSDVESPEIRIVDAYTEHEFLRTGLGLEENVKQSGYVFVRLYLENDVWMMHYIDEFFNVSAQKDLPGFLKSFINGT